MVANRREQLEKFVRDNPGEAFARYGLAMELLHCGESEGALEQFRILHQQHPDYPAAYQQAGQLLLRLGRLEEARSVLQQGVAAAERRGDAHAAAEMRDLIEESAAPNA